jgi:hypothetical protein
MIADQHRRISASSIPRQKKHLQAGFIALADEKSSVYAIR